MNINELFLKYKSTFILVNNFLLILGLLLVGVGVGATYQAEKDTHVLNESLYAIAKNDRILTDGYSYYYIALYENRYNFSSMDLINKTQCKLYGEKQ